MKHHVVAIIGAGSVGVTTAYALLLKDIVAEILLIDVAKDHAYGEVLDLQDALHFSETSVVRYAELVESARADIIIVTAGAGQLPGETRLDLLEKNKKVMSSIADGLPELSEHTVVVVVSNPVDILTHCLQQALQLPAHRVFGSGTLLDSQRLRSLLADALGVSNRSVHAYVLGEHGDSQFPAWSISHAAGMPLQAFPELDENKLTSLAEAAKRKAYDIIDKKGATYYGIAACCVEICEAILFNQSRILPVSVYVESLGVCLSVPVVLGESGVERILPVTLSDNETACLAASAQKLKGML